MIPTPANIVAQFGDWYVVRGTVRHAVVRYFKGEGCSEMYWPGKWFWFRSSAIRYAQDLRNAYVRGALAK